jgi:hypothetical protein
VLLIVALVASRAGVCAQLTPVLRAERLGILVENVTLPKTFRNDLRSGLTSRILLQVELRDARTSLAHRVIDISLKYDLWDETFGMQLTVDSVLLTARTYSRLDDVIAAFSSLSVPDLFSTAGIERATDLVITVHVLFDPLEKERMQEIRKWVTENSRRPIQDAANSGGVVMPPPDTGSRTLFDRIFEQYSKGASVAAAFTDSAVSMPFRLEGLRNEN